MTARIASVAIDAIAVEFLRTLQAHVSRCLAKRRDVILSASLPEASVIG